MMKRISIVLLLLSVSFTNGASSPFVQHIEIPLNASLGSHADQSRQATCGTAQPVYIQPGYQGRFSSPYYPQKYGGGFDCVWTLQTSSQARFKLICDPLYIPCRGDYMVVSPSGDPYFSDADRAVCGQGRLESYSKGNSIAIHFHSTYYTPGGGFSCVAQALPNENPTPAPEPDCECGIKGQNRVVGGQPTRLTDWPWQVLLGDISPSGGGNQYCGGTLISSSWVITAAHCTYNRKADTIMVVVGQDNIKQLSPGSEVRKVARLIQHPDFLRRTVDNDIALLELESPVTYSAVIRPICLPTRYVNSNFDGQIGVVTGWGTTDFGGESSTNLLEVSLPIISTDNCKTNAKVGNKITQNMFCTYADNKDACQGDSGGPLNWVDRSTGRAYLVGITSWGIGCANEDTPGVYTKVTNYLSWIQQYTGQLCSA